MHGRPIVTSLIFLLTPAARLVAAQSQTITPSSIAVSQSHLALSDFYAHDPFILADSATKTYYLYTAIGARQSPDGRACVVAYKSTDLKAWDGPHLAFSVPDGIWA